MLGYLPGIEHHFEKLLFGIILIALSIAGCNFPLNQTQAASSVPATSAAGTLDTVLTEVAMGTKQPQPTSNDLPHFQSTEVPMTNTAKRCSNRAVFISDLTIRDNTEVEKGESFVKIWRFKNAGTCIWNQAYHLVFWGGERMGAPTLVPLQEEIRPGETVDFSIDMTSPEIPGTHQGFWKFCSDEGEYFGIGPNGEQSFWVRIKVPTPYTTMLNDTSTPTITMTKFPTTQEPPTPTSTIPPTPSYHIQGSIRLELHKSINLDTGLLDSPSGVDVVLATTTPGELCLSPHNNALFDLYTQETLSPDHRECEIVSATSELVCLSDLAVGSILCYSTDEERLGFLRINAIDPTAIEFDFYTWER